MSAKELTIFFPESILIESNLSDVAKKLHLEIDEIPPELGLSYQFSAQRGIGGSYLLIEYKKNDRLLIQEICQWERPKSTYKDMLQDCCSSLTVYYRDQDSAMESLNLLAYSNSFDVSKCIVENGFGCLLKLENILDCFRRDSRWSWERDEFPELPDVAISEWR